MENHLPSRREILKLAANGATAAMLCPRLAAAAQQEIIVRRIPKSGEMLPAVGIGSYLTFDVSSASDRAEVREVLRLFTELRGRVVDSSPMYGLAESVIGEVSADLGILPQLFLATKVWTTGREAGMRQSQESMRRMRTQKLDLLQVHNLLDVDTHLQWLKEWKQAGKIRYLGVTHYSEGAYDHLEKYVASSQLDFVQLNYSMAERDAESRLLPTAMAAGTAVIVNRPFAQAGLFDRVKGRTLPEWAAEFDAKSWAQFFLKYIVSHPAVTCVIPATRNPKHVADNMGAGLGRLPDEKMRQHMVAHFDSL